MSDELFLDTNAFYYACGLSEITTVDIENLRKAISASSKTTLSVVSVYEFVSKFRKDIDAIHRGGAYQREQNIGIAFNPYFSADRELDLNADGSLKTDLAHITEDQLSRYLKRVINEKVYSEGIMAASILLQLYFIVIYIELGGTTIGLNADQYAALQLMIRVLTKWATDFCKALVIMAVHSGRMTFLMR